MSLSETDLAYMAGIVDVMCRLTKRKSTTTYLPQIDLNTPNRELVAVFSAMTGTASQVRRRGYNKSGCTQHCPLPHQHVTSVSNHWSVTGARATVILFNVEPYCRIRQSLVRELIEIGMQAPVKPASLRKMMDLGWVVPQIAASSDELVRK